MKKMLSLTLALALLLTGCGMHRRPHSGQTSASPAAQTIPTQVQTMPTTEPTTEPATEPATVPTEPPVTYFNPLNGTPLDEPYTGRVFATTVSNIRDALPHVGTNQADILMEMYGNASVVRCLAFYTDISKLESIGSTRSTRPIFNDLAQHYDAILLHAGGSSTSLKDASARGIDNFNVERWEWRDLCSFRDPDRERNLGYEHCLMVKGAGVVENAAAQGMPTEQSPDKDYFLRFAQDGTPENGQSAANIQLTLTYNQSKKDSLLDYDSALGKYIFSQYGKVSEDAATGEPEAFRNVLILLTEITANGMYQQVDFVTGGTGYFACGGKAVPITWRCDDEYSPIRFFTENGEPLVLGIGNTYIAISQPQSALSFQ